MNRRRSSRAADEPLASRILGQKEWISMLQFKYIQLIKKAKSKSKSQSPRKVKAKSTRQLRRVSNPRCQREVHVQPLRGLACGPGLEAAMYGLH